MVEIKKGNVAEVFTAKLGTMRKAVQWVIYPQNDNKDEVSVQCDRYFARFNLHTGKGMISTSQNYPTSLHISKALGGKEFRVDDETLKAFQKRFNIPQ